MASKKTALAKRASLPRSSDYAKQFLKDWDRLSNSGRYDMNRLKEVMLLLISTVGALPPEYKDHELSGEWADFRECNVGGDFLLIYCFAGKNAVNFTRAGTHSELFGR